MAAGMKPRILSLGDVKIGTERYEDGSGCVYLIADGVTLRFKPSSMWGLLSEIARACGWFTGDKWQQ